MTHNAIPCDESGTTSSTKPRKWIYLGQFTPKWKCWLLTSIYSQQSASAAKQNTKCIALALWCSAMWCSARVWCQNWYRKQATGFSHVKNWENGDFSTDVTWKKPFWLNRLKVSLILPSLKYATHHIFDVQVMYGTEKNSFPNVTCTKLCNGFNASVTLHFLG
jgi:hypothetical protein